MGANRWTAVAGIVAGAVALGVSQLGAAAAGPDSAPVVAVGDAVVDLAPSPVKNGAIAVLGPLDKPALIVGIVILLALAAGGIGRLAARRTAFGAAGMAVFGVIGVAAAATRPGAGVANVLPTLVGAAAGLFALVHLVRLAEPVDAGEAVAAPAETAPVRGTPVKELETAPPDRRDPLTAAPPAGPEPARMDGNVPRAQPPEDDDGSGPGAEPGDGGGSGSGPAPYGPAAAGPDRRQLLRGVAIGAGVAVVSFAGGEFLGRGPDVGAARASVALPKPARPLPPVPPGAELRIPGLSPFVTPNTDFYQVDTALIVPRVSPRQWRLRVHGLVDRPIELTFDQLLRRPLREADVTLTCVSNEVGGDYIGNARWLGAYLPDLLRRAGIRGGADMLLTTSTDGFTCGTPVDVVMDGREALLAVAMNGKALPVEHGFPVRQVVPGLYGYVSATKWITDIKVTRFADDHAYWTDRGWSARGPIKTESRIDVPKDGARVRAGEVTIAGVAWAQHKGIERVEVRVGGGGWTTARLAEVPGPDTWRQWSLKRDIPKGDHTIEVRATDATGETQTALPEPPEPNGASGYPQIRVTAA